MINIPNTIIVMDNVYRQAKIIRDGVEQTISNIHGVAVLVDTNEILLLTNGRFETYQEFHYETCNHVCGKVLKVVIRS